MEYYTKDLETKFKFYLNDIPENMVYSILPVLRRENSDGDYKTITLTKSIKITRFTDCSELAEKVAISILDALLTYVIKDVDIELLIIGRPWLSADDFNVKLSEVTKILDKKIKKETYDSNVDLLLINKTLSEKTLKLHNYLYSNIYMNKYGDPVYDRNKNLIGYKLNEKKYATIFTYYNENNLLCNKVFIRFMAEWELRI